MDGFLRQSTASQSRTIGPFIDDTDFKTPETALTIANTDIKLMANGAASANKNSGGGTHRQSGHYGVTFDATDTATVGELTGSIVVAGALPVWFKFVVLEEAVYDAQFATSAPGYVVDQPVNTTKVGGTTQTAGDLAALINTVDDFLDTEIAAIKAKTDNLPTDPADASDIAAAFAVTNGKIDVVDDFLDTEIAAIKAQTDLLPSDPADQSLVIAATNAIMTRLGTPVADVSTDIAAIKTETASIKAKTDNLPTDPADQSLLITAISAVETKVDDLPTNAELATALGTADDAVLAQVALVKAVTDKVNTTLESVGSPTDYVFTARALAQAPSGTGASAVAIADEVQTRTIAAVTIVNGLAANTVNASALAADAVTEIQAGLASQTSVDDLPTNAELATALGTADDAVLAQVALVKAKTDNLPSDPADQSLIIAATDALVTLIDNIPTNAELATALGTADDAVLAQVALVKAVTDKVNTTLESVGSPTDYVFTSRALAQAPSGGGSAPTAAQIADAVWDEPLAGHLGAGSTGDQLNNAAAAGNPWAAIIEGAYTAEDILRVLAAVAAGKSTVVALGNGQAVATFRSLDDGEDMVVANMNQSARTTVTLGV